MFKTSDIRKFEKLQIFVEDIVLVPTNKGNLNIVKCQTETAEGKTIWLSFVFDTLKHKEIKVGGTYLVQGKYSSKESVDKKTNKTYTNHYLNSVRLVK